MMKKLRFNPENIIFFIPIFTTKAKKNDGLGSLGNTQHIGGHIKKEIFFKPYFASDNRSLKNYF
jgi:hypothetical protein